MATSKQQLSAYLKAIGAHIEEETSKITVDTSWNVQDPLAQPGDQNQDLSVANIESTATNNDMIPQMQEVEAAQRELGPLAVSSQYADAAARKIGTPEGVDANTSAGLKREADDALRQVELAKKTEEEAKKKADEEAQQLKETVGKAIGVVSAIGLAGGTASALGGLSAAAMAQASVAVAGISGAIRSTMENVDVALSGKLPSQNTPSQGRQQSQEVYL